MSGLFIRNLRTNTSLLFKPSSSIIIRNSSFKSIQNDMKLLLNNNNNSKNRLVSLASSLSSSQPRVQKRFLSSEKSELDKAQWERSDRYVCDLVYAFMHGKLINLFNFFKASLLWSR